MSDNKKLRNELKELEKKRDDLEAKKRRLSPVAFYAVANYSKNPWGPLGRQIQDCAYDIDRCVSRIQNIQDELHEQEEKVND